MCGGDPSRACCLQRGSVPTVSISVIPLTLSVSVTPAYSLSLSLSLCVCISLSNSLSSLLCDTLLSNICGTALSAFPCTPPASHCSRVAASPRTPVAPAVPQAQSCTTARHCALKHHKDTPCAPEFTHTPLRLCRAASRALKNLSGKGGFSVMVVRIKVRSKAGAPQIKGENQS